LILVSVRSSAVSPTQYPLESEASVIYYGRPVQKLQNGRKHANQSGE
jgi:hypothetical protein